MCKSTAYAELHAISNFTFLRGASHPEELVKRAGQLGYRALAITDECSLAGIVRAHVAAKQYGLPLIVGSEFQLSDGPKLVLLASNKSAYRQLVTLITKSRRAADKGHYQLQRTDFDNNLQDCLALLTPGGSPTRPGSIKHTLNDAKWLQQRFPGSAWLMVELLHQHSDRNQLATAREISQRSGIALVAAGDVHMHWRKRRPLQDTLTAIRLGLPLTEAGHALYPNGERHLRDCRTLYKIYPPALLAATLEIADRCCFSLDQLHYQYPIEDVPAGTSASQYLRSLCERGMRQRWPAGPPAKVQRLVDHELALISELDYEAYFLTVYDIVRFAKSQDILCQGRGSAANSAVCYCLGITEVDPARMDLLFERFISKERNEPPDIDVDFEHQRREEVMQYIYQKYGRERAALTATVITYRPKSAVRDVGKALGFSLEQVDRLAKNLSWWDQGNFVEARLKECGFDPLNPQVVRLLHIMQLIIGFPRHLSQHVGGFVIAREPLSNLVPIENAAMPERTVIQWDKDDIDALGLLKVDCLCLGMLSAIHRAFDLIRQYRGKTLSMMDIPAEDPAVYAMIQHADTIGVFQIESRAQMAMLPRLKPENFYDLVIEVAIVRPGPIQGDMVHPYLKRRQGIEAVTYPSDAVRGVLERTLGIPIFQEQVIKLAMVAAGFSPGEADGLRRSMAAWRRRGGLEHFEQRLIEGMNARGYSSEYARRIFHQIQGFGEYGFPESHAASFALLAYVSAWLKHHEPAAFVCALLNSQPMGFYAPAQLVQDAQRHGVEVRPVCAQISNWDCTLEIRPQQTPALRLGLRMVKGLTQAGGERLVAARTQQAFINADDLAVRAKLQRRDLEALAAANALSSLSGNRHQAYWGVSGVKPPLPLLNDATRQEATPLLTTPNEADNIVADYASIGLTLGRHPLALLRPRLDQLRLLDAQRVRAIFHGNNVHTAGLVISRQRPSTAHSVTFVTLEDESGHLNVIVWRQLAERQRRILMGAQLLGVYGEVQREGEVLHLIAEYLEDHTPLLGQLTTYSRDFR